MSARQSPLRTCLTGGGVLFERRTGRDRRGRHGGLRYRRRYRLPGSEVRIGHWEGWTKVSVVVVMFGKYSSYPTMVVKVPAQATDEIGRVVRVCKRLSDHRLSPDAITHHLKLQARGYWQWSPSSCSCRCPILNVREQPLVFVDAIQVPRHTPLAGMLQYGLAGAIVNAHVGKRTSFGYMYPVNDFGQTYYKFGPKVSTETPARIFSKISWVLKYPVDFDRCFPLFCSLRYRCVLQYNMCYVSVSVI